MYSDSTLIPYNDVWYFSSPDQPVGLMTAIPASAVEVRLPHAWNENGWSYEKQKSETIGGTGCYYKRMDSLPSDVTALKFEGVAAACEIYLNGKAIGRNIGAYKPFMIKLDGLRRDGSDLLAVKVTDKKNLPLLDPAGATGEFQGSPRYRSWAIPMGSSLEAGGIWRNVWLVKAVDNRMTDVRIRSSGDELRIMPQFSDAAVRPVHCELRDAAGLLVGIAGGSGELRFKVPGASQWHPRHPVLYTLKTTCENQVIEQPAAFFDLAIRDSEFHINGKPYFLRGQNGFPHANIAHDREYIRKYVAAVREMGVEISRFHTEPPSHAWLDECDRQGVMVIFEMALHGSMACYPFDHPEFLRNTEAEMLGLIQEYRRHPSIAMWCLGNEMIVSCERDIGLTPNLFAILENWIAGIRALDPRPVVANSGGDGVEQCRKSVGDVDDMHQYGGWYVETLRDLRRFQDFTYKNEMIFQPAIVTESVAAYTDNEGCFFVRGSDTRQRKVVLQRLGHCEVTAEECLNFQAFILKEYAEQMWRLRHDGSNLSGYIPFGQYTWFSNPFDKGPNGLKPKPVWAMFRRVMGPVHVQLECWNRHHVSGHSLAVRLHLHHEDIMLPDELAVQVTISQGADELYSAGHMIPYHGNCVSDLQLQPSVNGSRIEVSVNYNGRKIAENYLDLTLYPTTSASGGKRCCIYDPAGKLAGLRQYAEVNNYDGQLPGLTMESMVIGPFGYDEFIIAHGRELLAWCADGGTMIVLEQNPSWLTMDMFDCGIGVTRQTQPHWSRWAGNMVRHVDRADLNHPDYFAFAGLTVQDFSWWNGDTFVANSCLAVNRLDVRDRVLMSAGNGLGEDELMPVAHPDIAAGISNIMLEKVIGRGRIIFCQALAGSKFSGEPVARKMLLNLLGSA